MVEPPIPEWTIGVMVGLAALLVLGCLFVGWYRRRNKKRAAMRWILLKEQQEKVVEALKQELEEKKKDIVFPENWTEETGGRLVRTESGTVQDGRPPPVEGLVPVGADTQEFWDVLDRLRADPEPAHARGNSNQRGMADAWITKLERIQNPDLYRAKLLILSPC